MYRILPTERGLGISCAIAESTSVMVMWHLQMCSANIELWNRLGFQSESDIADFEKTYHIITVSIYNSFF